VLSLRSVTFTRASKAAEQLCVFIASPDFMDWYDLTAKSGGEVVKTQYQSEVGLVHSEETSFFFFDCHVKHFDSQILHLMMSLKFLICCWCILKLGLTLLNKFHTKVDQPTVN